MSVAYLVVYEGAPEDPDAFLRYYLDVHVPIIWTWPGVQKVEVDRGFDGGDFFMVARFTFETGDDLRAALQSEGRELARRDREHFPPFHGTIRHQAVSIIETTRP